MSDTVPVPVAELMERTARFEERLDGVREDLAGLHSDLKDHYMQDERRHAEITSGLGTLTTRMDGLSTDVALLRAGVSALTTRVDTLVGAIEERERVRASTFGEFVKGLGQIPPSQWAKFIAAITLALLSVAGAVLGYELPRHQLAEINKLGEDEAPAAQHDPNPTPEELP